MHETKNEKIDASKVWVECAYNMNSCGRKRDLLPPKRDLLLSFTLQISLSVKMCSCFIYLLDYEFAFYIYGL